MKKKTLKKKSGPRPLPLGEKKFITSFSTTPQVKEFLQSLSNQSKFINKAIEYVVNNKISLV